jgi:hypothetical protein
MIYKTARALSILVLLTLARGTFAQDNASQPTAAPKAAAKSTLPSAPAATPSAAAQKNLNLKAYAKLLQEDVRSEKSSIMAQVMEFDPDQAAKFWPIYRDYDVELTKLNDMRIANIDEYAHSYSSMTDAKADQLIQNAISYQKQRGELLAKYYERVKSEMGAIIAARFAQVENQLLLLIDLQIVSNLPVVRS